MGKILGFGWNKDAEKSYPKFAKKNTQVQGVESKPKPEGIVKHNFMKRDDITKKFTDMQNEMFEKLKNKDSILTEKDVNYLKNTLNHSFQGSGDKKTEFEELVSDLVWNNEDGFRLTEEQIEKGKKWLMKHYKKSMGYREQAVIDDLKEIRLRGWHDNANYTQLQYGIHNYTPYYQVIGKDGSQFSYHMENGELSIDG